MEAIGITSIALLVLFPVLIALVLLVVRNDKARTFITVIGTLVTICIAVFVAYEFLGSETHSFKLNEDIKSVVSWVALAIEAVLCLYIIGKGIKHRKWIAVVLALVQMLLVVWFELTLAHGKEVTYSLYIDNLSIIMILIIAIIGGGICIYALGYMRDYQKHAEGKDRRPVFFAVMFAFLGAMFAIVTCNDMTWMLCAWEVTTVCSFALIGFTRTDEATDNSFLQITLNLIGGIAFTAALIWITMLYGNFEFATFLSMTISLGSSGYTFMTFAPLLLLALAAFTKAAQMPFQSWLLGAMVAPTPTSALLHSSTMVKAGVFLLIKMAPCLGFNIPGYVVMTVGIVTFLVCACAAISQSNAKRVLAYSTISNLGLITACAGVGTDGAVWAAIFLLIFHAAAKSLLFLCVGTAEHHIGSRDIEDMDDLFERMPRLARLMAIGILGMFIAPFGMLVSKWAALAAFAQSSNIVLLMALAFGSAVTFLFWGKWLGKILAIANDGSKDVEEGIHASEWLALGLMTVLTVGCCIGFPLVSMTVVVPYLSSVYGSVSSIISSGDLWIMAILGLVIAMVFLGFTGRTKKRVVPIYLAGAGIDFEKRTFNDSFSKPMAATQRNWYMSDVFGEKKMSLIGCVITLTLLVFSFGFTAQSVASADEGIAAVSEATVVYNETSWMESGISFSNFMQYYEYYKDYYDQNADALKEQGITNINDLMEALYAQIAAQSASTGSTDTGSSTMSGEGE